MRAVDTGGGVAGCGVAEDDVTRGGTSAPQAAATCMIVNAVPHTIAFAGPAATRPGRSHLKRSRKKNLRGLDT
ncbi:hypothetical protein [Streptosporangium sp. NBC_01756]|uniref:hypothetical protein n=1 Tax=Streptosporangium sp. NBC_01756 TaxID=2975950 RepID=UPI002DDB33F9|nr:hypothetical protein [Streptosporangium sp. NBC_01756]WSC88387.1 hypothetical protein OIE48_09430 [Streptosporangium sp. NBC_01756]